ncbi:serine hydrolase domain-containing protein [Parasphingorhabdus sp. DH2-15]|uniref:serine hydrolase domain-containing protein n=1 Tax=Parasphingorhabdus sp. DH2-15 TaxID=3444112 RepID=UPI003F68821F
MTSLNILPLAILLAAYAGPNIGTLTNEPSTQDAKTEFKYKAVPSIAIAGEPVTAKSMSEYADEFNIPAATMAVFKNGTMIHQEFKGDGVGPNSVFQAASLAKAISSATVVTLAMQKGISLDEDISQYITSFDLTSLEGYQAPVTLRQLLSHTSGADVGGFQGYLRSTDLPTNLEVILGSERSNSKRVTFSRPVGKYSYSGGGYQIVQAFAEDVSGVPFGQLASELVLEPVGMTRSHMVQSFDGVADKSITPVKGVETKGPVQGGWHNYPEIATSGLWTTAADYGKFLIAIMAAADGETEAGIHPEVAKQMLTVAVKVNAARGYGLGLGILSNEDGSVRAFEHHGKNVGYTVSFSAFPKERALSIVLTNHPNGLFVATESNRGFGETLGYIDPLTRTIMRVPFTDELRERCLGTYNLAETPDEPVFLKEEEGVLKFKNETSEYPLVHIGDGEFLYLYTNALFKCATSQQGVTLSLGKSTVYIKK